MMFTRRHAIMLATALGLAAGSLSAASAEPFRIGAYPSNPPFEYKNASGTFEGFEVDIATEAAKRAGLEPEIADYGFQALFAATTSGRIDGAISSITITPERLESQSFTQPYYDSDMGIAVKEGMTLSGTEELKDKTVGVLSGSTGAKWVDENKESLGIKSVKGYNAQQDMFLDLGAGRVDAVVSDIPGMEYLFTKMKGFEVAARIKTGEQYGMMMGKDHPQLDAINEAITTMKEDGTMAEIHEKWFGSAAPANSSTVTVFAIP